MISPFLKTLTLGVLLGTQLTNPVLSPVKLQAQSPLVAQTTAQPPDFLVVGGGPDPCQNEIALEKNVLYFQRTLNTLGFQPTVASIFFANGNNGQTTIRYLDEQRLEQYKAPAIPHLNGAATVANLQNWMQQKGQQNPNQSVFFYFTGHGGLNGENPENNFLALWHRQELSVQELSGMLDKLPPQKSVVAMMAQCYSGSFANLIYQGGDPKNPIALQTRCGFFATVKGRPAVGCTPEVNEADYRDYSSSFFAGLSGRSRTGEAVPSADYNRDGRVSYAEAHAFAKVDDRGKDWPISTSEAWLQSHVSEQEKGLFLKQPIKQILLTARPEQRYVVESIGKMFKFNLEKSYLENDETLSKTEIKREKQQAYWVRMSMELINISLEKNIRTAANPKEIVILDRLIKCESGSWNGSPSEPNSGG
jgi:hypothetical protein